jgi:hypothetical protein
MSLPDAARNPRDTSNSRTGTTTTHPQQVETFLARHRLPNKSEALTVPPTPALAPPQPHVKPANRHEEQATKEVA